MTKEKKYPPSEYLIDEIWVWQDLIIKKTMKDKFLKYFRKQGFIDISTEDQIQFNLDRYTLKLEDNDWNDICFDIYIKNTYITCVDSVKRLKKIIKLL